MPNLPRALALLSIVLLTGCGPKPPSAMELYRLDQIRQGKVVPETGSAEACVPRLIARLPIDIQNRLLIVPVTINDQTARLVVDTGAERTTLSEAAAARLRLPRDMSRIGTSVGIGGSDVNADGVVSDFKLGSVNLDPVRRVSIAKFGFPPDFADGLLGADVLLAFGLDIDVPGRMLAVYSVHGCGNSRPGWSEPFETIAGVSVRKDRLLIPFELDGVVGQAILDTGASATTIGVRMANRMGLTDETMSLDRKIVQSGVGPGSVAARFHWFRELRVGPADIKGLMLSVLPTDAGVGDALIGEDFLEGRRVWLSYPTRQVFVSKLAHEIGTRP